MVGSGSPKNLAEASRRERTQTELTAHPRRPIKEDLSCHLLHVPVHSPFLEESKASVLKLGKERYKHKMDNERNHPPYLPFPCKALPETDPSWGRERFNFQ